MATDLSVSGGRGLLSAAQTSFKACEALLSPVNARKLEGSGEKVCSLYVCPSNTNEDGGEETREGWNSTTAQDEPDELTAQRAQNSSSLRSSAHARTCASFNLNGGLSRTTATRERGREDVSTRGARNKTCVNGATYG